MLEGTATLGEISQHYSLADVYKANSLLDMRADIQEPKGGANSDRS